MYWNKQVTFNTRPYPTKIKSSKVLRSFLLFLYVSRKTHLIEKPVVLVFMHVKEKRGNFAQGLISQHNIIGTVSRYFFSLSVHIKLRPTYLKL